MREYGIDDADASSSHAFSLYSSTPVASVAPVALRVNIQKVSKLGAKPFEGKGNPERAIDWLDKVDRTYDVMEGCIDQQRVLFSSSLLEDPARL